MGWRDRVKKSFADSAYNAEGIQNLKNPEKKEKGGLKTTFRHLTQYTQNTQNPKNGTDEGGKSEDPKPVTPSKVKDQSTPKTTPAQNIPDLNPETNRVGKMSERQNKSICSNGTNKPPTPAAIPSPSPPGMGPEDERVWNQAWELAEWIDDPAAAHFEDRRAKLAELDQMRERMAEIVRRAIPLAAPDPEPSPPGTWHTWESTGATTRDRNPENCPAQCRRAGKCYAGAYFKGKPGRAKECEPEGCKHISNERGSHDSQTT